ncbi:MAG: hypothetical protein GY822_33025 [Deltaproteobacteria bacterium]|nr:hypothetical protein [Deltaproteobacteria bacterium]
MFEGVDTCVVVERRDQSEPDVIYKTRPWSLEKMTVKSPFGEAEEVDMTLLYYESTHHNWNDAASMSVGDELWKVSLRYPYDDMFDVPYQLAGLDSSGNVVWGPIALTPVGS